MPYSVGGYKPYDYIICIASLYCKLNIVPLGEAIYPSAADYLSSNQDKLTEVRVFTLAI